MSTREYNHSSMMFGIVLICFSSFSKWFHVCQINPLIDSSTPTLLVTGPRHIELTTRRACVLLKKSWTVGFSLVTPLCRWHPKKFSRESWHKLLLRNIKCCPCTSGRE